MTFAYLAVLIITIGSALASRGDIFSPARAYLSLYSFLLFLYSFNLSRIQTPWSTTTNVLFFGATFMFIAAAFLAFMLRKVNAPAWSLDFGKIRSLLKVDAAGVDWIWFSRVFNYSALIFFASFAVSAWITKGVPAFSSDPDNARIAFFSANIVTNYGIFFGPLAAIFCVEMLIFAPLNRSERNRTILIGAAVLLLYMMLVTRYDVFRFMIIAVVLYHYGIRPLGLKHIAIGTTLVMVLFLAAFLIRFNTQTMDAFNEMVKVKMPAHLSWASSFYAYLANDFWNMDYAFRRFEEGDHEYPMQYGFGLMRGFLVLLQLDGGLAQSFGFDSIMNESTIKVDGFNTIVFIWHFYKDFGAAGVFLLTFLLGLAVSIFHQNTLLRPTVFRVMVWAMILPAIILSFHTPLWELWFFHLGLFMLFIAHRKLVLH